MIIKMNYDLFQKLEENETGISISRTLSKNFKVSVLTLAVGVGYGANSTDSFLSHWLLGISIAMLGTNIINNLKSARDERKSQAEGDLSLLCINLKGLDVSTDIDLLKESSIYHTHYEIKLNKYKLPVLVQQKFIMVKTTSDEEISLLQEHNMGGFNWELSKKEPKKVYKLRLAKTNA